ncbi:glutamate racemase [Celeribacter sp.]|uniref:glutamate racemase n=1 Tax=Celeribacter sp. TaxID=1890673 RepID=UPI003A8EB477
MQNPIAVFDAGIGSYAIVAEIHKRLPQQDILYFADRASFPYGQKSPAQLRAVMQSTLSRLQSYDPVAIVMASNAPSIMVLDDIRTFCNVPLYGVFPPLEQALNLSVTGHVGIMGVASLTESEMLTRFIAARTDQPQNVARINASAMVRLVESGAFLFDPDATQQAVSVFIEDVFARHPDLDTLTLSSTHLPWLRPFFERARPTCRFLDPAADIVTALCTRIEGTNTSGTGQIQGLVTETPDYDLATFRKMLAQIGADIPLTPVPLLPVKF